jgi:lipopolysaccharide export system protein LptA
LSVKLQKVHTYNLIRLLRAVLPVLVAGLIAVPVWNYLARQDDQEFPPARSSLVEDVSERTENMQYTRREGGRTVFTVDATERLGMDDGRQLFGGVRIMIAGQDASTPDRLIDSDNCGVDDLSGNIECTGNIEIRFDDRTLIRTAEIRFDNETQTITTMESARIERPGVFEADAGELSLQLREKVVSVRGSVRVRTDGGLILTADRARYDETADRIELVGAVRFESARGVVRARQATIDLIPKTMEPGELRFEGSVTASSSGGGESTTLGADRAFLALSDGIARHLTAAGAARAETAGPAGPRVLIGDALDAFFDVTGELLSVEADGKARMLFGDGRELRSDHIRNEIGTSVLRSTTNSILEVGDFRVQGESFLVRQLDEIEFETDRRAVIQTPSGTLTAAATRASFDPDSGVLTRLSQTGGAEFLEDGRRGSGDRIELEPDGEVLLDGHAKVSAPGLNLEADIIRFEREGEGFDAAGSVRAAMSGENAPVLIEGDRAVRSGGAIRFSSEANLWQANMHVAADTIDIETDERRFSASGSVASTFGAFRVWADTLEFDDAGGTVRYSGGVRGRSTEADLDAGLLDLVLKEGEVDRVVASESVRIRSAEYTGTGDQAVYQRMDGTVTLVGSDAEVVGSSTGTATGPRFVWNVNDNGIVLTGDDQRRAVTRRTLGQR